MPPSRLDGLYRRLLITKFFEKGWGKPENLQRLFEFRKIVSNRELCYRLVPPDYPVEITKDEKQSDCHLIEGKFLTPLELYLPGLVPNEAHQAHFQMLLPLEWKSPDSKPMCIHLAGTGDHFFWRRRNFMAKPLLREAGIGAIILENPFYGLRKPKEQVRSNLHSVSDILVMGGCLVLENLVLMHWCERNGLGPLGVTGVSMGGHMASLAATNWPKPIVLVPCLSWSTAASVFTQGVMSQSINWDFLETQYFADGNYRERLAKMVTIVDDAFLAGQSFAKHFNQSMNELKEDIHDIGSDSSSNNNNNNNNNVIDSKSINNTKDLISKLPNTLQILSKDNKLELSESLFNKLQSKDKLNLTNNEINELNSKIQLVYDKELKNKIVINEEEKQQQQQQQQLETEVDKNKLLAKVNTDVKTKSNTERIITSTSTSSSYVGDTIRDASNALTSAISASTTKLMKLILPPDADANPELDMKKKKWEEREAKQFMRGVMDECTHLKHFSKPYDTSLVTVVCAKDDAYVPRDGCTNLADVWPGADIKYVDAGHVSAYVLHHKLFRSCIIDAFERAKEKHNPQFVGDVPYPTITYDELTTRYSEYMSNNNNNNKSSDNSNGSGGGGSSNSSDNNRQIQN